MDKETVDKVFSEFNDWIAQSDENRQFANYVANLSRSDLEIILKFLKAAGWI